MVLIAETQRPQSIAEKDINIFALLGDLRDSALKNSKENTVLLSTNGTSRGYRDE
jgi:hypothetical protein